jgi:hypothetical protein
VRGQANESPQVWLAPETLWPSAAGLLRFDHVTQRSLIYLCLLVIPVFVISLPMQNSGAHGVTGDSHAGFVDLIGFPLMLLLMLRLPRSAIFFALFVFLGTALISVLSAQTSKIKTLASVYRLIAIYTPFAIALSLSWTPQAAERAVRWFWWSGLAGVLLGMFVYWIFGAVREHQQALHLGESGGVVYRAGGMLGNSGGFSHLITGWAMSALCLRWLGFGRLPRWQLLVTLGLLIYGIIVTASRAAVLQVAAGMFFALLFMLRAGRSNAGRIVPVVGVFAIALLLLLPLAAMLVDDNFLRGVMMRFGLTDSRSLMQTSRWDNWAQLVNLLGWTPIGIGYKTTTALTSINVDNSYLRIFFEMGVLGLLSFIAFWGLVLFNLLVGDSDPNVRRVKAVAAGMLMGELARMFFSDTFTMYLSMPTMALLMGIMLRLREPDDKVGAADDTMGDAPLPAPRSRPGSRL